MSALPSLSDGVLKRFPYQIGVIIPTYNRSDVLLICLKHLEQQIMSDFEVIVVDDGSTDSTPQLLEEYQHRSSLHLRYIRQENSGPARARNVGIAALQAPICLMIGDDILASPVLISTHLQFHQQKPDTQAAALGLTRWSDSGQTVTKFMRWLDDSGMQFAYNDLLRGVHPDWKHFYTSNLSLKTRFLRENPFNELFTKAAMEDMELGYRLELQHGLDLTFIPEALAHHLHPTSFRQACKRMLHVGQAGQLFHDLWPSSVPPPGKSSLRRRMRNFTLRNQWILPPLTQLSALLTSIWCPNPLMQYVLMSYRAVGSHSTASYSGNRQQ